MRGLQSVSTGYPLAHYSNTHILVAISNVIAFKRSTEPSMLDHGNTTHTNLHRYRRLITENVPNWLGDKSTLICTAS